MNIYEILESGQVVVLGNEDLGILITWNGKSMLNLWLKDYPRENWANTDVRTRHQINQCLSNAISESQKWVHRLEEER